MTIHYMTQGDTSPPLERTLTAGSGAAGNPVDLADATVTFEMRERTNAFVGGRYGAQLGEVILDRPAYIVQSEGEDGPVDPGEVEYEWRPSDTAEAGVYAGRFTVTYPDDSVETFPNTGYFLVIIHP